MKWSRSCLAVKTFVDSNLARLVFFGAHHSGPSRMCQVDTPHKYTLEGDSVLFKFVVRSPALRSRQFMTRIIQKHFSSTVSVKSAQSRRVRPVAFIHQGACAPDNLRLYFDSSTKKWTFGSGSLLFQRFRRRHKETAWKRRRIESSLVIVIFMLRRVLTYVVSYKAF